MDKQSESTKLLDVASGDQWSQQKRDINGKGKTISSLDDLKKIFHDLLYPEDNKMINVAFQKIEQKIHLEREKVILMFSNNCL